MSLIRAFALVAVGAITLACGGVAGPAAPKVTAPTAPGTTVSIAGSGGSTATAFQMIDSQFTQASGVKVQYTAVTSLAAGLAQMQAQKSHPTYDVFLTNEI